jgi:predicted secreted Zn-dependent protease
MNKKGPTDPGYPGEVFDGYTKWQIYWTYPRITSTGCSTGGVTVTLTVEITLPHWVNKNDGSTELQNKWNSFLKNLTDHENTHKQYAFDAASDMYGKLNSIAVYPNCTELDKAVDLAANSILDGLNAKDDKFDAYTNHGRNQGVSFP